MTITDKYTPLSFAEIVGLHQEKVLFTNFMNAWALGRPFKTVIFLYGHSGNGKNALVDAFCAEHEVPYTLFDPCEYADKADLLKDITETLDSGSFEGVHGIRVIVIDGVEYLKLNETMKKKMWAVLRASKQPVVLIGNAKEQLDYRMRRSCMELHIKKPSETEMFNLLRKINSQERFGITDGELLMIVGWSYSIRSAILNLQCLSEGAITLNDLSQKKQIYSVAEQIQMILNGEDIDITVSDSELPVWIADNGGSPDFVAVSDLFFGRAFTTKEYRLWKYAFNALRQCRSDQTVEYPRCWVQMNQAKIFVQKRTTKRNQMMKDTKSADISVGTLDEFW